MTSITQSPQYGPYYFDATSVGGSGNPASNSGALNANAPAITSNSGFTLGGAVADAIGHGGIPGLGIGPSTPSSGLGTAINLGMNVAGMLGGFPSSAITMPVMGLMGLSHLANHIIFCPLIVL